MFCRVALPKIRTLSTDDEVILCNWQRVQAPELLYLTCNVTFTIDIDTLTGKTIHVSVRYNHAHVSYVRIGHRYNEIGRRNKFFFNRYETSSPWAVTGSYDL